MKINYIEAEVLLLESKEVGFDKFNIIKDIRSGELKLSLSSEKGDSDLSKNIINNWKLQHLYVLSKEEIKDGDWYIWLNNKQICQAEENVLKILNKHIKNGDVLKIIATTDRLLGVPNNIPHKHLAEGFMLPKPSKKFIELYIKFHNSKKPIINIQVETESYCAYGDECPSQGAYDKQHLCNVAYKIKLVKNTITIKYIEPIISHIL